MAEIEDLKGIRNELQTIIAVIQSPQASSGLKKRATRSLCEVSLRLADTAIHALSERQQTEVKDDELV